MVFSSVIFLFFFLPIVLVGYYLVFLPAGLGKHRPVWLRSSNLFLLLASLVFYFWGENYLIWILAASVLINYSAGLLLSPDRPASPLRRKIYLAAALVLNLSFLFYYKYFNFGVDNLGRAMEALGVFGPGLSDVARITLPLGISFYTFQAMSYTIDVYRGRVSATRSLIDFACYVTMFPQLVAGPIVRYYDVARQLVERTVTRSDVAYGAGRFIVGLGKKVLIANTVAQAADGIFALPAEHLTFNLAWIAVLSYTLQIYFDFSGYSDMAIGLGRMLGFNFPENFNYPYASTSIREFWRRWHISLSTWFRDYLYIPLGGSRKSTIRTYFNLVIVFLLCGFWHGASWTFVVWGLFHGFFLVLERLLGRRGPWAWNKRIGAFYTFLVVIIGWTLFRAETFGQAANFFQAMVGFGEGTGRVYHATTYLGPDVLAAMAVGGIFSQPAIPALAGWLKKRIESLDGGRRPLFEALTEALRLTALAAVLVASSIWIAAQTHNPFIYFRF